MAKVLKVAAIVVGVAALAVVTGGAAVGLGVSLATSVAGISASTLFLVSAGLSVAAGLLTKPPTIPSSQTSRLTASIDPRAPRKTALGSTALATDVRYEEWSGDNQDYCDWIICLASHAIDGVDQIWLNDELAWSAAGGVTAKYNGYFSVPNIVLEGSPANAFTFASGKWNAASARLTGCAYLRARFKVTGNSKKADSPFSGGPTSRMTIIGRGAKLYDPRRDSSVGGDGPMRADDQSTWRYTADDGAVIGENLPLHVLRVLLGWRITNPVTGEKKLAVGAGLPAKRLDLTSFIIAANQADEMVNRTTGADEPRYHGAGVISEGDDPKTTLDALCAGCCGRFLDTGGRLSLAISHNDLAEIATDEGLLTDDVVGGFTWDPDPALEQTPNVVRGRYVDPSTASLYQLIDYPEVRVPSTDGIDRILTLDLGFVESPSQAQRVAKQVLQRKQYDRSFTAPFDIRAWNWPVGKVVPFTFAPLGFVRRPFRVAEQEVGQDGVCNMTLKEENAEIYAWDADDKAAVQAADPIVYDPTKSPIVQAINDTDTAALQQAIANSFPIGLTIDAADDGTITIGDHIRRYTDGHADVNVTGATIDSGLVAGDFRAIGYDDYSRVGGAVTYQLFDDDIDARAAPDHPGRHYGGYVDIPTAGSPPSSGGGATPPGGACVTTDTPVMMKDGTTKPAGDLKVGDWLKTRDELTLEWGFYPITAIAIVPDQDVMTATIAGKALRATPDHPVLLADGDGGAPTWTTFQNVPGAVAAGTADVVKMTVARAATYVSNDILSHNAKAIQPDRL